MARVRRNRILIVLLAVVLLAPLFELFDESDDIEQGNDFVLALLCVFVATSLFLLCRRLIAFLFSLIQITTISPVSVLHAPTRSVDATASPPESLLVLTALRI